MGSFGDKISIDFDGKPGHSMKLQFAANSLEVLGADHIFAKFVGNPEETKQMAIDDPVNFAFEVLTSFGGSLFLDHWEDKVKGRIVSDEKYKSWWESAKKKIRADRRFSYRPKETYLLNCEKRMFLHLMRLLVISTRQRM